MPVFHKKAHEREKNIHRLCDDTFIVYSNPESISSMIRARAVYNFDIRGGLLPVAGAGLSRGPGCPAPTGPMPGRDGVAISKARVPDRVDPPPRLTIPIVYTNSVHVPIAFAPATQYNDYRDSPNAPHSNFPLDYTEGNPCAPKPGSYVFCTII